MNAKELKDLIEDSQRDYLALDIDYKKHFMQYAVGLLIAQLSVIGFLLQNEAAKADIKDAWTKAIFLTSISLAFLSIVLSMLAKRFSRNYSRNKLTSQTYRALAKRDEIDITVDGFDYPQTEDSDKKISTYALRGMRSVKYARISFLWAEVSLVLTLGFSVVFIFVVVCRY
jgi:hypothetical protein